MELAKFIALILGFSWGYAGWGHSGIEERLIQHYRFTEPAPVVTNYIKPTRTPEPPAAIRIMEAPEVTAAPPVSVTAAPVLSGGETLEVFVTYFGWPDNCPAATAIAYPVIHSGAGGVGTFNDPVTFAAKRGRWPAGTKMYVPYIRKYIVLEDMCASCNDAQVDIWMNSDSRHENAVIELGEYWTRESEKVEIE